MVSSGAIAAVNAARIRRREEERRRKKRAEENKRRMQQRLKEKKEKEEKERRRKEELNAKRKDRERREYLKNKSSASVRRAFDEDIDFYPDKKIKHLPTVVNYTEYERILADGSLLVDSLYGQVWIRTNGSEIEFSPNSGEIHRENIPDGRIRVYNRKTYDILYERKKDGSYELYNEKGFLIEIGDECGWKKKFEYDAEGNVKEIENINQRDPFEFTSPPILDDVPSIAYKEDYRSICVDGSVITKLNENIPAKFKLVRPDGAEVFFYEGSEFIFMEKLSDGRMRCNYDEDNISYEKNTDGDYVIYDYIGSPKKQCVKERGNSTGWNEKFEYDRYSGVLLSEMYSDGRYVHYDEKGILEEEKTSDGVIIKYHDDGSSISEIINPDGSAFKYNINGDVTHEYGADKFGVTYHEDGSITRGKMSSFYTHDSDFTTFDIDGNKIHEVIYQGSLTPVERKWNSDGVMIYEKIPNVSTRTWNDEGLLTNETLPDGTRRTWNDKGILTDETLPDRTRRTWNDKGILTMEADAKQKKIYKYYDDTDQLRSVTTLENTGVEYIKKDYKHYTRDGVDDTSVHLAIKNIATKRIQKETEDALKTGEKRKIKPRMSKAEKMIAIFSERLSSR